MTKLQERVSFQQQCEQQLKGETRVLVTGHYNGDFVGSVIEAHKSCAVFRVLEGVTGDNAPGNNAMIVYHKQVHFCCPICRVPLERHLDRLCQPTKGGINAADSTVSADAR